MSAINLAGEYKKLPVELSGSRVKNRFRMELLWGVSKLFDLLEVGGEFTVVFDYACDIEVHLNDGFEFYQIKTHAKDKSEYTINSIGKIPRGKKGSIIGKLYALKSSGVPIVKLAIVSNVGMKRLANCRMGTEISLENLDAHEREKLEGLVKRELGIRSVDFSSVYFIYDHMDLLNPVLGVKGKIITSFEKVRNEEPVNPNALYRLIFDTVERKACYEYSHEEYDLVVQNKGITRDEFVRMLDYHSASAKTGVRGVEKFIDAEPDVMKKREMRTALAKVIPVMATSRGLKELEHRIVEYLKSEQPHGDQQAVAQVIMDVFGDVFDVEVDNLQRLIIVLIVVNRYAEGGYGNADDVP